MILTARYVLPVVGDPIEWGSVVVEGDRIVAVGPLHEILESHEGHEIRDFGLAAIMPGFVDAHTHLEYTVMRGLVDDAPYSSWKAQLLLKEPELTEEDWRDSARMGAAEAISSGITTIADITASGASLHAAQESGLRGIIYREVQGMVKREVGSVMESALADIEEWRSKSDEARITVGMAAHAPYSCHPELFGRVAEFGEDGTPIAIHLAGSREEYSFVKYGSSMLATDVRDIFDADAPLWLPTGVSPVRYVLQWGLLDAPNIIAIHCTQVDDDDIEILRENDVAVAHCPRCNAKLGMGVSPVRHLLQAGIRVGLGTDSPAASNSMDPFEEMRVGLLVQRAVSESRTFLTAQQFVEMATIDAARALGIDSQVGSLERGKLADIIAVDLSTSHQVPTHDPAATLVHTANQDNILMTMVGGDVLFDGELRTGLDMEALQLKAEELRKRLRAV